jgi:hypothetical protein
MSSKGTMSRRRATNAPLHILGNAVVFPISLTPVLLSDWFESRPQCPQELPVAGEKLCEFYHTNP